MEERMEIMRRKQERDEAEKEQRRLMIEQQVNDRIQARQRSIGEMVHRTKQISSAKNKPVDYYFVKRENSEQQLSAAVIDKPLNLKTHSLRYEEIIRKKKEELRRQRNLEQIQEDQGREGGSMESDYIPPPNNAVSFKSHLHQEVRQQQREIKGARTRDLYAKIKMADRAKSYAKNVKEMYMPRIAQPKYSELPEHLPPPRG